MNSHKANPNQKVFVFVICALTVVLIISQLTIVENVIFNTRRMSSSDIYIVSIVNTPNWVRSQNLYEKWGKDFIKKFPYSMFRFVTFKPLRRFDSMTLFCNPDEKNYRGFLEYFNTAVRDFLENTSLSWLYRTTEDCLVDVALFGTYMKSLVDRFSPDDVVIRGHAAYYSTNMFFIHGGSGWIMSRAACKLYMYYLKNLTKLYMSKIQMGDDVLLGFFTNYINLSYNMIDDKYFLGSPFNDRERGIVENQTWELLPNCSQYVTQMARIKDLVFWHSGRKDNYPISIGINAKKVYPDNIYYDQYSSPRQLCQNR